MPTTKILMAANIINNISLVCKFAIVEWGHLPIIYMYYPSFPLIILLHGPFNTKCFVLPASLDVVSSISTQKDTCACIGWINVEYMYISRIIPTTVALLFFVFVSARRFKPTLFTFFKLPHWHGQLLSASAENVGNVRNHLHILLLILTTYITPANKTHQHNVLIL